MQANSTGLRTTQTARLIYEPHMHPARFQRSALQQLGPDSSRSITEQWRLHTVWHTHVFSANVAG